MLLGPQCCTDGTAGEIEVHSGLCLLLHLWGGMFDGSYWEEAANQIASCLEQEMMCVVGNSILLGFLASSTLGVRSPTRKEYQ